MNWVIEHSGQVWSLTLAHTAVTVPAVLLSVVFAVPLGWFAHSRPRLGQPLLAVASFAYAIPALPLLVVLPVIARTPLRSWQTMVLALTVYGVALLVRSAADAFASVDAGVRQAAVAQGFSPAALLWQLELPLALPVLIAGVRVVSVSTVSLVTIGALIGVPGLGSLLTDGFQRGIVAEVISGIVATMLLALVLDACIVALGWALTPWRRKRHGAGAHA